MRKVLFLAVIAVLAVIATGCKDGKPSSLKGTWVNEGYVIDPSTQIQIKSVYTLTVNGSEETNVPGTLTHVYGGETFVEENVLVNYSDGKGSFTSADGSKRYEATIKAEAKDELEINLNKDGYPMLVNSRFFKK